MATTPHPLVWSFYRQVEGAEGLGGVVHYYDESSQSFWLSSGIKTNLSNVKEGHWKTSTVESTIEIETPDYSLLELEHAYNGVLFGAAFDGENIVYLRYLYAMDCSDIISSGSVGYSNNNPIVQLKVNLMNSNDVFFRDEATVFQPGGKVTFKVSTGEDIPYDMCVAFLDSTDYGIGAQTIPISGRNNIGFKLMESTFDDVTSITGEQHKVVEKIFEIAGITDYAIESGTDERTHEFRHNQTLMSGVEQLMEFYHGWKMVELPSGKVVVGYNSFIKNYMPNGYYVFDVGSTFKRKTKRSSDGAYTKVMVTGKDINDNELNPVILPVNNYAMWRLPQNKTYHKEAPAGLTQEELQDYAQNLADLLQFVGVGEDFTCSLQPQLMIGDVAAINNGDGTTTTLGIVTSVKHNFGKSGFTTEFSTDSGGILMETRSSNGDVITITKPLNGYTRKQTLKDIIQVASGSAAAGPKTSGNTLKVVSSSNAYTLEGKTYEQIVQAAVDAALKQMPEIPEIPEVPNELPPYTETDYGKVLMPSAEGLVWADVTFAEELPIAEEAEF